MSSSRYVIIPAAGIGTRMGLDIPKQYYKLSNGKTILDTTLEKFIEDTFFDKVILAINVEDSHWQKSVYYKHSKVLACTGGNTRFDSVYNALKAIENDSLKSDWVFVHDAARPCVNLTDIKNLYKDVRLVESKSGILAVKALETVKKAGKTNIITIEETIDRSFIWLAQTPQLAQYGLLKEAFDYCYTMKLINKVTDEASALELFGVNPIIVEGSKSNIKITTHDDLNFANWQLDMTDN